MSEPLVLLPGMMCDARLFLPQVVEFSSDTPVTVAPITGGERVEEIASALLAQLPARFALAGLSLGGIVAMEVLRRAPERVTRIALMATTPLPETPDYAASREPRIMGARAGRLAEVLREELPANALAPGGDSAEILALVQDMGMRLGAEVFVRQSRALQRRKDQVATLRKIRQPVLVLCGEYDSLTPVKRHAFMAELIPYAKLVVVTGAGHLPVLEQPRAVNRALRDWMRQPLVLR
ncbi:MAG: alpha/beta fold hydrolase [Rhodobacterales bacterium]|nr:alpha/beta fold hydrolase [Rhodobacterales bacterium]NCT12085.1 alpha/beta fold hydrolase [Rhodobacterales bacterium]